MSNNLKDPRFLVIATLFTIYGLFILCIFLFSSGPVLLLFWKKICLRVVRRFCGVESEMSEEGGEGGVSERRDTEMRVRRRYVTSFLTADKMIISGSSGHFRTMHIIYAYTTPYSTSFFLLTCTFLHNFHQAASVKIIIIIIEKGHTINSYQNGLKNG